MSRQFDSNYLTGLLQLQSSLNETAYGEFILTPFPMPPSAIEVIGLVVIMVLMILCNAGGVGGGGNSTPFIVVFFNLTLIECIPIGNFLGFISAFFRFIINYREKHPNNPDKLAIDYEIIELTMPLLYLGTLFGVQIGTRLPEIYLAVIFAILLFFVAYKTSEKAYKMIKDENKKLQISKEDQLSYNDKTLALKTSLLEKESNTVGKNDHERQNQLENKDEKQSAQLRYIMKQESQHFTPRRCLNFALTLIFLITTSMLLNSKDIFTVSDYVKYAAVGLFIVYSIGCTIVISKTLQKNYHIKLNEGYQFDKNDITYENPGQLIKVIVLCFISGILGGIVGISGGIILAPLFIQLGMLPTLVSSTNQYLALISTISVSFQYWYLGMLNTEFVIVLGIICMIGCYIGVKQVQVMVKKSGRQSIIVVALAFVLFASFLMIPVKYWLKSIGQQ
ncbi:UNKNOWN [Stylonychia lemnae]|uniref:Sulfite exporter TauE/SafE n=1 Tax=Stylonychia lemnae TaxID=5949 RepID=A0A078BA89_STYLE|nr:UNKNOWN [Stylonychia lemnae]|eukprot:CDW90187.1 UNKNOWN [Stylonychia lemnae]